MVMAFLARLGASQLVRRVAAVVSALALVWLLWTLWLRSHDREVVEDHETKIEAQTSATASAAATDAAKAVETTRNDVEKRNAEARAAASDSPDLLRAAFDSLRR